MRFKRLLLIFTIFVVLLGINATFAIDSDNTGEYNMMSSVSNESLGSDSSILEVNGDNQRMSSGNVIIIDAEDNHNEMEDPTIQVAINNANANDTIIINGKSYVHCHFVVDKQLTIISNVDTSMTPCPSNSQGSGYRGIFYISPEASGTVIKGFTINNNLVSGENDYGVLIRGASDVVIRNCEIMSSASADAIRIEDAKNTVVENITVNSLTNAIRIRNSQNTLVNNSVVKNSNIGVNIIGSVQTALTNNVITSNKASGIYIGDNVSDTSISFNNITYNNGKGMDVASVNFLHISNNYIAFNKNGDSGAGIYINCNVDGLDIRGNVLQENGNYAVLYDYRVRNIGPDGLGENAASVSNNYIFGHTDRAIYHITYNKDSQGSFIYDAENDEYIAVGYGNGDYSISMTTAYLGYSYLINEQLCPSIYFTWGQLWSYGNYRLVLSNISQINKGIYTISVVNPNDEIVEDLSSIYVTFYLNKNNDKPTPQEGDVYKTVLIQNGTATVKFDAADFKERSNVLTVSFPGPNPTLTGNPFKRLNIPDSEIPGETKETSLTLSNLTTYPNSGESVIANLKDKDGHELAGKDIAFVIDSQRHVVRTDENGNANFNVSIANEGFYDLAAIFEGDNIDYFGSEAHATVIIRKITTNLESEDYYVVPGIADNYSITLKDEFGNPVSGQNVTFYIDGKNQIITTDSEGQGSLEVLFDVNNTDYKVTMNYDGSEKYVDCSNSSFIHVRYSSKNAELIVPFIESIPYVVMDYNITLKGFNGEMLDGELLIIDIDGVEYRNTTDSDGQVTIRLELNEIKDYEVVAFYNGSSIYKSVSNSSCISVAKANTKFVAQNITVLPYIEIEMPVALKTYDDECLPNQEFCYEIEGVTYYSVTDGKGDSIISYTFSNEGIYSIKLTYNESDQYKGTSATAYVTVKKIISSIESYDKTFSRDSSQNFTITLSDENGDLMVNQEVIFTVNGNNVSKITDSNGRAGINIASNVGSFDVVTSYAGSDKYSPVSKTNEITVLDEGDIVYIDCDLPNSEIQWILDSCNDGDVVKFLGGVYENISLTISRELDISPKNKTTLNAKESFPVFIVLADNTSISDFDIVANSGDGIDVSAINVRIHANNITNKLDSSKSGEYYNSTISLPGYGINVSNSGDVEIINNAISLFESGIYVERTSNLVINENYLKENNYGIKYGFEVSDSWIINNTIVESIGLYTMEVPEGPRGYGIFLNNSAVNVSIVGNIITWNHLGISIDSNGSTGIIVTSNLITDSVLEGIRFNAGYDLAKDAVEPLITDNAIYRNARGPSMMILGEMSANPAGIYGPGEWDDDAKLHIAANWYGVNALQTWNNETGIVGIGTMCPRIKTYEIKFDTIVMENPGFYSITLTKDGEVASNLPEFDLYATLNKGTESEQEVHFNVIKGVGQFNFDLTNVTGDNNFIDISVGSLSSQERVFKSFYTYRIKVDTSFSVVYESSTVQLLVTLSSDATGQAVVGNKIDVSLDGVNSVVRTDNKGQAKVSTKNLAPGTHNIIVSFNGTSKYNPTNANVDFIIKADSNLSAIFDIDARDLTVSLVDAITGSPLKGANVVIMVEGVRHTVKINSTGQSILSLADLAPGNYIAIVSYKGGAKYEPSSTTVDITVNKAHTNLSAVYDSHTNDLVVSLVDTITGSPLKGAYVVVNIAGENHKVKITANGEGRLSLADLDYGIYATTLTYKGNAKYVLNAVELDVVVKDAVSLSAVYDSRSKELVVSLTDDVTNAPLKGANVIVNIAGENHKVKITANGEGRLSLADLDYGTYCATLTYNGNAKYAFTTVDLDVVVKDEVNLSAVYDDTTQELTVSLFDSVTGVALKGAYVVVNIDGENYKVKITSTGQGKLLLTELAQGTYTATATYKGNAMYVQSSVLVDVDRR